MSGRRLGASPETAETIAKIEDVASSIRAERAADAWNHAQYVAKGKENYDLLYKEKAAEQNFAEQNRIWEAAHRNFDALKAAEAELETIRSQRAAVKAEAEDYRARVDQNAQNVLNLRQKALYLISTLPEEIQAEARRTFDPCFKGNTMQGAFLGQVGMNPYSWNNVGIQSQGGFYSWNGYGEETPEERLLKAAQESMNAPAALTPQQRLLKAAQESMNAPVALTPQQRLLRQNAQAQQGGYGGGSSFPGAAGYGGQAGGGYATEVSTYGGGSSMMMGRRYPVVNR
jgi:hypothetical protein